MNFPFLAFIAGSAITIQASMNAQLGILLKSSSIGTAIAFVFSALFTLIAVMLTTKSYPALAEIKTVPIYLWFSGGD